MHAKPDRGRHPDFDKHWDKHVNLIWWLDGRLCSKWKRQPGHFTGWLTCLFNRCLWHFDPAKGKMSTYLTNAAYLNAWREVIWKDTDDDNLRHNYRRKSIGICRARFKTFEEQRADRWKPEQGSWTDAYLDRFEEPGQFWTWLSKNVDARKQRILTAKAEGKLLREIGEMENLTKERVRQVVLEAKQEAIRALEGLG